MHVVACSSVTLLALRQPASSPPLMARRGRVASREGWTDFSGVRACPQHSKRRTLQLCNKPVDGFVICTRSEGMQPLPSVADVFPARLGGVDALSRMGHAPVANIVCRTDSPTIMFCDTIAMPSNFFIYRGCAHLIRRRSVSPNSFAYGSPSK